MATLTVESMDVTGNVNPTFVAAAGGGDDFANDGSLTFFIVKNGGGAGITVTFNDTGSAAPAGAKSFDADVDVSVGASQDAYIGPFPVSRFGSSVGVTYSGVTSVTVAPFKLSS